ncbi:tyrosine-type recombinase/integrase [Nonomuraea sp. CA-143628]|uniref:tyrosine-type recombinase/integrase n=1 Tax=Nonomuraea sp. CA-143628 TaxID=3239997 RepID=UPI003D94665E
MGVVEGQRVEGTTKSGRTRVVSIDDTTATVLRDHQKAHEAEKVRIGDSWKGSDDTVFTTAWRPDLSHDRHRPAAQAHQAHNETASDPLPVIRLHDLRHIHATLLLLAGVPVHVVAARLGHADPAITLRVYAHVIHSAETAAADIFARTVKDTC